MKFQVGDKVEVVSKDYGISKGTVLTVKSGPEGPADGGNYYFEETSEIVLGKDLTLHKLTKNQRITALEKEVAELKKILNEIQNGRKTMRDTMNELLSEPSTTDDIIEFEGNQYRKVDREARKGDVVIFKDGIKPVYWITIGKPYKATEGVDDCEKGEFIGDICGEFPIYRYDDFNRTRETVDVYELIKQELSPNQQRAQIIEKAKKFIEQYGALNIEFVVNEERRTVLAIWYKHKGVESSFTQCHPNDVFNEYIGKAIALGRLLKMSNVSEFEQAVQPNEIVVGMFVGDNRIEDIRFEDYTVARVANGRAYDSDNTHARLEKLKIINDTNAQYEEVK